MGVLDKKDEKTATGTQSSAQPSPKGKQGDVKTGYESPLFEDRTRWNDDRMIGGGSGDKMDSKYHDKKNVLKVTNGLCVDIFFRAEDIECEGFDKIPDFAEPVKEEEKKEAKKVEHEKPLDSRHRKRTYLLTPEEQEEKKKPVRKRPARPARPARTSRPRSRGGRKPARKPSRKPRGRR